MLKEIFQDIKQSKKTQKRIQKNTEGLLDDLKRKYSKDTKNIQRNMLRYPEEGIRKDTKNLMKIFREVKRKINGIKT